MHPSGKVLIVIDDQNDDFPRKGQTAPVKGG